MDSLYFTFVVKEASIMLYVNVMKLHILKFIVTYFQCHFGTLANI